MTHDSNIEAELTRCTEFWKARVAERDAKVEDIARRNAALETELALVTAERNEALSALEELVKVIGVEEDT